MKHPYPQIYIAVDDGAKISLPIDSYIRISVKPGIHNVRVIMKGSMGTQHRWYYPTEAHIMLAGIEADEFLPMPEDNRENIEIIGDSIRIVTPFTFKSKRISANSSLKCASIPFVGSLLFTAG